jgi:hypothetical protein
MSNECDVTYLSTFGTIPTDAHHVRTSFQRFLSDPPLSFNKKLIVLAPRLLRNLHTMSLAKVVLDGLKDRECKKMTLRERPPIPYVPGKDSVQETVSSFKEAHLKTMIKEGTKLRVPIWHSGTREAFLIHVGSAREAIEKKGYFKSFEDHSEDYSKEQEKVKELKKLLEALKEALAAQPQEEDPKETAARADNNSSATLHAETKAELKQATLAAKEATDLRDKAAADMFQLYANLLSVDARYAWNKIVQEQTEANPYQDLQRLNRKGPRGMSRKSFEDCVMFHLLTKFPNNAAEQERYYITNVLKKPQRVSIRQFVQRVEQLNSHILQLPCWYYYSPSVKVKTVPMNVSFAESDLASHVLRMCPYTWQDQYNLHKKGGAPTNMRSLLQSLEAIERVCGQEGSTKSNSPRDEKPLHSEKKGTKRPGTESPRVPKKVRTKKHCNLCKKHGGTYTTHNTRNCRCFEKDGTEKADFRAAKKGGKKPNPMKQSFAQLSKKLDKLEKVLKKRDVKKQKRHRSNSNSDSE